MSVFFRPKITDWDPDNEQMWAEKGHRIAERNLWISIYCLALSFGIFMLFSVTTVNLDKAGFNFSQTQLFTLAALPAITGALLRIPYSVVVPIFGGRLWTIISVASLLIPTVSLGFAVQDTSTPYSVFVVIALLCGFGGGNFASSMANISMFFPKSKQGGALGLEGGIGNAGVGIMQLVAPIVLTVSLFGWLGVQGTMVDGKMYYLANIPWVWVAPLVLGIILAWLGMDTLDSAKSSIGSQLHVLKSIHLWLLGYLNMASFGSFLGFCAAFAMLSKDQFPHDYNLYVVFVGPILAAFVRPMGGIVADKIGGMWISVGCFVAMIALSLLVFDTLPDAQGHGGSFDTFFIIFVLLFVLSGFSAGSTYQMLAVVFRDISTKAAKKAGMDDKAAAHKAIVDTAAASGFISVLGAVGGYLIPQSFGWSLAWTGNSMNAMYAFIAMYVLSILLLVFVYGNRVKKA